MTQYQGSATLAAGLRQAFAQFHGDAISRLADEKETNPDLRFDKRSYGELASQVWRLAHYFRSSGLVPGDKVYILAGNCASTVLVYLACAVAGLVIVPPFPTSTQQELSWYFKESEPQALVVENRRQLDKLKGCDVDTLKSIVSFKPIAGKTVCVGAECGIRRLQSIIEDESIDSTEPHWIDEITGDTPALLLYSASETGIPHGVVHTQASLRANADLLFSIGAAQSGTRGALVLFLAHIYPILMMWVFVLNGITSVVPSEESENARMDAPGIMRCLRSGETDVAPLVPHFLYSMKVEVEKEYVPGLAVLLGLKSREDISEKASGQVSAKGKFARLRAIWLFLIQAVITFAIAAAIENYERRRVLAKVTYPVGIYPLPLRRGRPWILHILWRWVLAPVIYYFTGGIRAELRANTFGKRMKYLMVGGSRLTNSLQTFWEALGIEVIQGYGTSESGISHVQRIAGVYKMPETVGYPLGGVILQEVDPETGELSLMTPARMAKYANDPAGTAYRIRVRDDGNEWYKTGDTVQVTDLKGSIRITGRIPGDTMYNSLGGEKVYPIVSESLIRRCDQVDQVLVWGDGQLFNVAIVVPSEKACADLAMEWGLPMESVVNSKELLEIINRYVNDIANAKLPGPMRVKSVVFAKEPFRIDNGLLDERGYKVVPKILKANQEAIKPLFKGLLRSY
jgi:long-subunit acyl-CoA synthetase (AMP-forming)